MQGESRWRGRSTSSFGAFDGSNLGGAQRKWLERNSLRADVSAHRVQLFDWV
jgi:hypothetical protein